MIKINKGKGVKNLKKLLTVTFVTLVTCFAINLGTAHAFLTNWYLDADGVGGVSSTSIKEYMDMTGNSRIANDFNTGTFSETAVFKSMSHDGAKNYTSGSPELTGYFTATGTLTGTGFSFTGGSLNIYSDAGNDYGSTNGTYGADNGTLIGTFTLLNGGGFLDGNSIPNGDITATFAATYLKSGYWFNSSLIDLSTLPLGWTAGFATTGASLLSNPDSDLISELGTVSGVPNSFYVSNNGQFRLNVVPEPATMLLFGMGVAGLATRLRNKKNVA